jgi:microcompartment protein CcmL/EutN
MEVPLALGEHCIGSFILGNPHPSLLPALYGTARFERLAALGVVETYDVATALAAADLAAKTAVVDLLELRVAKGMCGKSYFMLTGEVAAVEAAVAKATAQAAAVGMFLDACVIPRPSGELARFVV